MRKMVLKIEGMHCEGCAASIENFLRRVGGVTQVDVDFSKGIGSVVYDEARIGRDKILGSMVFREPSLFKAEVSEEA